MKYWCYYFSKFVLWLLFRFGFGLDVRGQAHVPRRDAFILASNHLSFLDPPLLGAACPRRLNFMARSDLFRHRFLGTYLRAVRVIPLQRGEADLGAIREAVRRLRDGQAVAIFPEGGRQFSGTLGTAKRGVGLLAEIARVPILPVFVRGTFEALPPRENRLHRTKIRVAFGPVIPYTREPARAPHLPSQVGTAGGSEERVERHRHHEQLAEAVTQAWRRLEEQLNADGRNHLLKPG